MRKAPPLAPLTLLTAALGAALGAAACSSPPPEARSPVLAAPPPKDNGGAAKGGEGGTQHAAALEQLKVAPAKPQTDRQGSVRMPLPDGSSWTRVRFWSVPSLVGFRYGKGHHAVVGAFITHVEDNTVAGACTKSFEAWATPWVEAFEVELQRDPPLSVGWRAKPEESPHIVEIDSVFAKTATLVARDNYAGAYAAYPAWGKASCLIVGVAVPSRGEDDRAKEVRDRFVHDVLPKVELTSQEEPKERY